jgi:hypothetical protein
MGGIKYNKLMSLCSKKYEDNKYNTGVDIVYVSLFPKDKEHLQWIYNRLVNVHGEDPNYDYMLKFKEIINKS